MELFLNEDEIIVSKTDLKGNITYGNQIFIKLSGYNEIELLGKPHNLIRHPEMPKCIFKFLWQRIQSGEEIFAYVVNQSKNGDFYWVLANVTPSFDQSNKIIGYHSVRRKPKTEALKGVQGLYATLLSAERSSGITASQKILEETVAKKGVSYDEFILSL
ncbi:MAG: PAS domain-containing protein [Campylobacteraceae bacterium]|nr:PAS domain-containing protein [Campylobacteraceae bacterium]